jgi:RNA polymerase sigma factor (sigma-70 family)
MSRMSWLKSFRRPQAHSATAVEFDRLIREHVPILYRSAYRWTGAVDRAEDLVQELLVRLYPRLDELRALDQVRPWAMRVMYRIFVDQLRRERNSPVQFGLESPDSDPSGEEESEHVDPGAEPPELVERQLTQERIAAAWARLAEEHRVVLSMHDIEGYSLVELSAMMDTPLGTLKSRLHRARAKLRELLTLANRERFSTFDRV